MSHRTSPAWRRSVGGHAGAAWLLIAALFLARAAGAETDVVRVEVQPGQTVRDLARRHLGSPDLWRDILALNGLGAASDVRPGMELSVPDLPIAKARAVLDESLDLIQEATALGGSVFASELLGEATSTRDEALQDGSAGRWNEALAGAEDARRLADLARARTRELREQSGQAVLASRRGQVQGRRAEALVWTERPVDAVLVENERVRTLSESFAEVRFPDQSQIRLGENAQAVIQSMQIDRLNDRRRTTVSLVEGDAFALLGGGGRRDFDVQVESVDARIDSKNFWVRRDGSEAKFANYDDRPVKVSSGDDEVTLGWNQGTVVSSTDGPAEPKDLLPPPQRMGPADDSVHYRETVLLRWQPVDGAAEYSVEVDRDARFAAPVLASSGVADPVYAASGLGRGVYFWRVRAVDGTGFPGAPSGVGRFAVDAEGRAPYLIVTGPRADGPTGVRSLVVAGETEPTATLRINGQEVVPNADGLFRAPRSLRAGGNRIRVEATSPAGLTTEVERSVRYLPGWFAPIAYDPGVPRLEPKHFVTRGEALALSGTTSPEATVEIVAKDGRTVASTLTHRSGRFRVTVPLEPGRTDLRTRVTTGSGFSTEEHITATRDSEPPALYLPTSLPRRTRASEVTLAGRVEPDAELRVNGVAVKTEGERFLVSVPLSAGGNRVRLAAIDRAGNVTERTLSVARDVGPPLVEDAQWLRDETGRVHGVRVVADDPAGLRRVARFRWATGEEVHEGALRLESDGRTYVGRLPGPQRPADSVRMVFVELEDRLGNRLRHEF